jgi:hypothetical protein
MEWTRERLIQLLKEKQNELCAMTQLISARVTQDDAEQCFIGIKAMLYLDRKHLERILGDAPFAVSVQTEGLGGKGKPTFGFKNEEGARQRQANFDARSKFYHSKLDELSKLGITRGFLRLGIVCLTSPVPIEDAKIKAILGDFPYELEVADITIRDD